MASEQTFSPLPPWRRSEYCGALRATDEGREVALWGWVGARRDQAWGPIVTVGLGGIWIEALHDIRILPAAIDRDGIIEELQKLKGAALLRGGRGTPAADLEAIADCVLRLGALIRGDARITEIEINPLRVYPKGALALDVLMQVEQA